MDTPDPTETAAFEDLIYLMAQFILEMELSEAKNGLVALSTDAE